MEFSPVRKQYENWPYPAIPLVAKVHREQLWQLNFEWMHKHCGLSQPSPIPKIWIAGCGTFQPYVISQANPRAEILATDLSSRSLKIAKRRCQLHGSRRIHFARADLNDLRDYPEGPFDYIECYGVLMSLKDPGAVLKQLADRLSPNGMIRLMVYPHYSRQRIFQIQRVAKILGLDYQQKDAPRKLKKLMRNLPPSHPLRYSFDNYADSRNREGIVDGFLHASDRGFSGIEICDLIDRAGLEFGFFFHRPWGQPVEMAKKLELGERDLAFWLHYLDLWQSLKTNFVFCLTKKGNNRQTQSLVEHPLFKLNNRSVGIRHRMRLLRLAATGTQLTSKTHGRPLNLKGADVRKLLKSQSRLLNVGSPEIGSTFSDTPRYIRPNPALALAKGNRIPNPIYSHLFEAFDCEHRFGLPPLETQVSHWQPYANPLENYEVPVGLTPMGSYRVYSKQIRLWNELTKSQQALGYSEIPFPNPRSRFRQVREFVQKTTGIELKDKEPTTLRELWYLLFFFEKLFVRL